MDSRLDDLIAAAAPPHAERTDHLRRDLATLVEESEALAGPRRRRRFGRLGILLGCAAGLAALGTAASAAGLLPMPWYDDPRAVHVQPPGAQCRWTFAAREFQDESHPVGRAERTETMAAARHFLAQLDVSTLSVPQAVADYRRSGQVTGGEDRADLELLAVSAEVGKRLSAALARQGRSQHAVGLATASDCANPGGTP